MAETCQLGNANMSSNEPDVNDDTSAQVQQRDQSAPPKRKFSDAESPLDFQIRQLTKHLEEMRKRRKLVELQEEIIAEELLYQQAHDRLSDAWGAEMLLRDVTHPVDATLHDRDMRGLTILGSAQTPKSHEHTTSQDDTPINGSHLRSTSTAPSTARKRAPSTTELAQLPSHPPPVDHSRATAPPNSTREEETQVAVNHLISSSSMAPAPEEDSDSSSGSGSDHDDSSSDDDSSIGDAQTSSLPQSSPPAARPSTSSRRMSPVPPEPRLKPLEAKNWWECRNYMGTMETHFAKYPSYYSNEDHKINAGKRLMAPELKNRWTSHISRLSRVTWYDLCAFLANQLASEVPGETARRLYSTTVQKPGQSITEYAIWLQQFAPHVRTRDAEPMRDLYDRVHPSVQKRMERSWRDFRNMATFVAYLQSVEDSLPEREAMLGHRKHFPKRG